MKKLTVGRLIVVYCFLGILDSLIDENRALV